MVAVVIIYQQCCVLIVLPVQCQSVITQYILHKYYLRVRANYYFIYLDVYIHTCIYACILLIPCSLLIYIDIYICINCYLSLTIYIYIYVHIYVGLALGSLLSYILQPKRNKYSNVYVLCVKLTLRPGGLDTFKEAWRKLANYCRDFEPNTLSYELLVSEHNEPNGPREVMVFERYITPKDLTDIHHKSEAFLNFNKFLATECPNLVISKERATYWEQNIGFMEK